MEEFFNIIANFGFPIAIAGYLLIRFESKIEKLEDSITGSEGLNNTIKSLVKEISELRNQVKKQ